jgi:hypothetical protein
MSQTLLFLIQAGKTTAIMDESSEACINQDKYFKVRINVYMNSRLALQSIFENTGRLSINNQE